MSENEENLQKLLLKVEEWCHKWQLVVNKDKSQIVHFRQKNKTRTSSVFNLDGTCLAIVEKYKYLGIVLDEFIDFNVSTSCLAAAGGRALGAINSKFKCIKNMGVNTYSKLFESCVMPVLHYCAGVWGLQSHQTLQNIQNRAMRFFLGTHKLTPNLGMVGDLGWYSLLMFRKLSALRLWNRFIKLSDHRLTKKIFKWDWEQCNKNWSAEIKQIFYDIDMNELFDEMHFCPLKDASDALKEDFEFDWSCKVKSQVKLRTYNTFKTDFGLENYLQLNLERSERSFMAQLRLGILPLHVETGRFNNTPLNERICKLCDLNVVEDETHFILNCSKYIHERKYLFDMVTQENTAFVKMSGKDKLSTLFTNHSRQLAKFIKNSYHLRFNTINVKGKK